MSSNPALEMLRIAITMLVSDRPKYAGLLFGIAFTSFLVTFAASYFCGFMTWGFALIAENTTADVWVMDPAVQSPEHTTNIPDSALDRVRSVEGVRSAVPLALGTAEVRFPNGRFEPSRLSAWTMPRSSGCRGQGTAHRGMHCEHRMRHSSLTAARAESSKRPF